jgi:hypothetical protein
VNYAVDTTNTSCPYRKSNPKVLVMQTSENRIGGDPANPLDRARNRCILVCVSAWGPTVDRQRGSVIPIQQNQWPRGIPVTPMGVIFRSVFTPDADRHAKPLIHLVAAGSMLGAYSQLLTKAGITCKYNEMFRLRDWGPTQQRIELLSERRPYRYSVLPDRPIMIPRHWTRGRWTNSNIGLAEFDPFPHLCVAVVESLAD